MLGNKVSLHRSSDNGDTYGDLVGDLQTLEPGERTSETFEDHKYGAEHDWKEYEYGLKDGGEWTIGVTYREGQSDIEQMVDAYDNSTKEYVQFRFPSPISKALSFRALVTKVGFEMPKESRIERKISLKVDGPVVESNLS